MYSFDHDLEEFVAIGLGTVSKDGTVIRSNDGVGVIKAGWHCGSQPDGGGCGHSCQQCYTCTEACNCVFDHTQADDVLSPDKQTAGDCKDKTCSGSRDNNSDILPEDTMCKQCVSGSLENKEDTNDPFPSPSRSTEYKQVNHINVAPDVGELVIGINSKSGWKSPQFKFDVQCKTESVCMNGEVRFQMVGDIEPDWNVYVATTPVIDGCPTPGLRRSEENIKITKEHENKHRDALLGVINRYKPKSSNTYESLESCQVALADLRGNLITDFSEELKSEIAHKGKYWGGQKRRWLTCTESELLEGWCGDPPKGDCEGGNTY